MAQILQRITTEYIAEEDRLRLSGVLASGVPLVVWMNRRLLLRLLPALLRWLEGQASHQAHGEILQGFAQQAARAALEPQAPVQAGAGSAAWLAGTVHIAYSPNAVQLTLLGGPEQEVAIIFPVQALRQWLNMIYEADRRAEWRLEVWPGWLREGEQTVATQGVLLH